jgi:hypothetical protein
MPLRSPLGALASALVVAGLLITTGCTNQPSRESQRLDQLEFKLQQLEQRLQKAEMGSRNGADQAGKPPAGPIKSLTLRTGTADDRLRIYWADGTSSDLPCTKEQATLVCG